MTTTVQTVSRTRAERRSVTINLRASARLRDLIDRAAAALGQNRSEFMLDSVRRRAEDILLDQHLFLLDDARYEAFVRTLDHAPKPARALRNLLATKAPWEK
jgi:uncharacterized protein (DUF1778 family)